MTNGNDTANVITDETTLGQAGLTKREEFAKTFMAAMLSNSNLYCNTNYDEDLKVFAEKAMIATDAIIAELNKTN